MADPPAVTPHTSAVNWRASRWNGQLPSTTESPSGPAGRGSYPASSSAAGRLPAAVPMALPAS